jgi:adhesin HecA-like repeat protein
VSVSAGSVDNSNGSLLAAQSLSVQSNGQIANAAGLVQSNGNLSLRAQGAVINSSGQIEANGATSTLAVRVPALTTATDVSQHRQRCNDDRWRRVDHEHRRVR